MPPQSGKTSFGANADFAATRWSVVLAAGGDGAASGTRPALEQLIQAYWFPLYAYARRQGEGVAQAEDLVQGFLTSLLERADLARVDPAKGKFRSFLLASLKHFMSHQRDRERALKRGGGRPVVALDAEARYALEPADRMTPDRLFDRRWALAVLEQVMQRLRAEYAAAGKGPLYEVIKDCLAPDRGQVRYAQRADSLGMTAGALKVAVHRMRRRYRQLLRDEIAQTVDSPGRIDEEIAYLLDCL